MLVEFTAKYGGKKKFVNPQFVVFVESYTDDSSTLHLSIEVNNAGKNRVYVLGTPAEVAAKLNGAEVAK